MPSPESLKARQSLVKETVNPSVSLAEERSAWEAYAKDLPIAGSVAFEMKEIAAVACGVFTPAVAGERPIVIYAHGGGLTAGSVLTHRALAAQIAKVTGCMVILPDYRLLPENPLPAPRDDVLGVCLEVMNARAGRPVFLGGDSSGAGLAISVAARLQVLGGHVPAGCFSISGAFDATLSGQSMREKDQVDPILSKAALRHWQGHFEAGFKFDDPLISPLFGTLEGLPPMLLLVGEDEVWLDDTLRLNARLCRAGGRAEMQVFEGMWHVWPMTPDLPESQEAFQLISAFIARNT